ncbi:MAG: tRNA (adenosine(37)-N6)-dimethylallyltransferase MiaA [Burkholderiales bacterium]|nr:tRNA (adenosine(37)-N6)-dimethylallyltransferase MiaA [Burkholderiales bacterium]
MGNPSRIEADRPQALCLAGPTASGKSAVALALAERLPLEIISVDSALVYRGMDIGTAKPTLAERAAIPHHLIDIRDPRDAYSAAEFARDARRLITEIAARGRLPLLVGGTMLYFKALLHGLDEMPPADPALRQRIEADALARGWPALHAELARVDPVSAARLAPQDSQRIQRALEVWQLSGRPLSAFHSARTAAPEPAMPLFSLEPTDRAWLHRRIEQRFDTMLADGFLDEVRALRARGDLNAALPSMRCVGYRQAWQALEGEFPLAELRARGIAATRQLAKRQLTWLRGMAARQVLAVDELASPAELAQRLLRALAPPRA